MLLHCMILISDENWAEMLNVKIINFNWVRYLESSEITDTTDFIYLWLLSSSNIMYEIL